MRYIQKRLTPYSLSENEQSFGKRAHIVITITILFVQGKLISYCVFYKLIYFCFCFCFCSCTTNVRYKCAPSAISANTPYTFYRRRPFVRLSWTDSDRSRGTARGAVDMDRMGHRHLPAPLVYLHFQKYHL